MRRIIIFLAILACFSCKNRPAHLEAKAAPSPPPPSREELIDRFREEQLLLIVYSEGLEELAQQLRERFRRAECRLLPEKEASRKQLRQSSLLLLGAEWSNPAVRELVSRLPFDIKGEALKFGRHLISGPNTILSLSFYPNPLDRKLPLSITTAFEAADITKFYQTRREAGLSTFSWASMGYEVYQDGRRLLMGAFDEETWEPEGETAFDFTQAKDTSLQGQFFEFILHQVSPAAEYTRRLMESCEANAGRLLDFLGGEALPEPIPCHIYNSIEQKGLRLNNTQPAQADFTGKAAHMVANEIFAGQQAGAENAILLRQVLGKPQKPALEEGLSIFFTQNWQGKGYRYWANRLYRSGNLPPLSELFDDEQFQQESPLVRGCLAAVFVDFLIHHWGKAAFLEQYPGWQAGEASLYAVRQPWQQYLEQLPAEPELPAYAPLPYLKGFNFAHEGYAIYNGYGSGLASQSLRQQAEMGVNAVAIVPYSYLRNPRAPSPFPLMQRAGSETDEGVVHDAYTARQLGMATILKPQVWLGRGSWPGDVEMQSEEDWRQFFDHYYRWMRHYALLAEINRMDMLCVGVEFSKATLQRPDDWRRLIRKLRGIYSGPMVYAANWGKEFESLEFWDELDYIGLDCYYPLSQEEKPGEEELKAAFQNVLQRAQAVSEKYSRPVIFTEIGFTSTTTPWKEPHKDGRGRAYDGEAQKQCYRIVMEALSTENENWNHGLLWWKFPTYLSDGGPNHKGFTPNGKPAEEVVREWFGKLP